MIGLIGINFKTAPVEIREKFSFTKEEILKLKNILRAKMPEIGVVVLSTCNRTEIYCSGDVNHKLIFSVLLEELARFKNYNADMYSYFYFKKGLDAAEHLFSVASGIDSLIIGEDQIIGQIKEAYYYAEEIGSVNKITTRLFLKAIETGKRVRNETHINEGSASASSSAIQLSLRHFPNLEQATILLVGAGKTGELILSNLHKHLPKNLFVANRTLSKAKDLAKRNNGKAISLEQIEEILPKADLVFIATDAKKPLIPKTLIEAAAAHRPKQLFIDLSVPRNIEKDNINIENVQIFTIDDLQEIVKSTNEQRKKSIINVKKIIDQMLDEYSEWMQTQAIVPTIKRIKQNFQKINKQEFAGFVKIKSLQETQLVEEYADHITEKFARLVIKNFREISKEQNSQELSELVSNLMKFN